MDQSGLGVVVIGRNEGARLVRCLQSVIRERVGIVYVDSGSIDGSVEHARSQGVEAVDLDGGLPFTAARARNAGFERLLAVQPGVSSVQFLDGDCQMATGWLERGQAELERNGHLAIVVGHCRERCAEASLYSRLVDVELDTPPGDADACGGNFMVRTAAFREVGGFDSSFIAGEEPELCLRLRERGWRILRLDAEMALHDAAITSLSQWWRRTTRTGYAYARTAWSHPARSGWQGTRALLSVALWTLALPLLAVGLTWPIGGLSLLLLGAYPLQWAKIARRVRRKGRSASEAQLYAFFVLLGKFAQASGALRFLRSLLRRSPDELIEYKGAASSTVRDRP